jgi:hypothetical protein
MFKWFGKDICKNYKYDNFHLWEFLLKLKHRAYDIQTIFGNYTRVPTTALTYFIDLLYTEVAPQICGTTFSHFSSNKTSDLYNNFSPIPANGSRQTMQIAVMA